MRSPRMEGTMVNALMLRELEGKGGETKSGGGRGKEREHEQPWKPRKEVETATI